MRVASCSDGSNQMKSCIQCGRSAEYSICSIISTVGRPDRKQQCSVAVPLCDDCLQGAFHSGGAECLVVLRESLKHALDALTARLTTPVAANGAAHRTGRKVENVSEYGGV